VSEAFALATWEALGTSATVLVTEPEALPAARLEVEAELDAIDIACSRFRDDSELARLNAGAGRPVKASRLLLQAVRVALRAAVVTDGAVDPTIGEALMLAGYDRDFAALEPSRGPLRAARVPGWRKVAVDAHRRLIAVPRGVQLDLGATAKALAADRAAAAAHQATGAGVLVSLGGDIAVAGPPPGDDGWLVHVAEDHRAGPGDPGQAVSIRSGGLASSSTTVRRWGAGAHHIIDPTTGLPVEAWWRTVCVAAASCVDANIASTAAIVRGEPALAWLRELRLPARLVHRDGHVKTVGGWPGELAAAPSP
jgi:thiamine biosynthesis lipoprotein